MKPSEAYFLRNLGSWDWDAELSILSYRDLWRADIPVLSKLRLSTLVSAQHIFAPFRMWMNVDFRKGEKVV